MVKLKTNAVFRVLECWMWVYWNGFGFDPMNTDPECGFRPDSMACEVSDD